MNALTKNSVKPQKQYQLNNLKNEDNWCISDFSLNSTNRIVLSGSKHATRETFIKVFSVTHSEPQSRPKCLYSREFNRQDNPEQWRLVSFLDNSNLVTCFSNRVEKISITDDKIIQSKKLKSDGASCIFVQSTKIFIGFSRSSIVLVFNSNLQQTSTISLNALQDGWPVDFVVVPDTLLVCSFGCVPRRALSLAEKDGQLLREYTNPRSDDSVPLSLTVIAEADLVAILWNSPPQLTIHSFSHGNCLVVADVEPAERVRSLDEDKLVMVDEQGELKVFHMGQFFTMDNLKATLLPLLSCVDCKELGDFFGTSSDQTEPTDDSESPSKGVENDKSSETQKLDFFRCLEENNTIHYGDVTELLRACTQLGKGRNLLSPLEAYAKYGGDCESRLISYSGPCVISQDSDRHVDERGVVKRRLPGDDPPLTNEYAKRKRNDRNASVADSEPPTCEVNQGLADTIKRAVKEAVDPLLTEIQSLKQQNDLMMCYLRIQPFQHSSSFCCSCFHHCQPPLAQPCAQLHTHACSHIAPQPCSNLHMQFGNGFPSNCPPTLHQQSQQQSLVPPHQSVAPHPQVVSYPQPPVPHQPYRQLPPPHSTHVQAFPNYCSNTHSNLPTPDHRQSTTTESSTHSSRQQTDLPPSSTSMQTSVQAHTGIMSTYQNQGQHIPGQNGATNFSDGFGSPPSLQAITRVPPQGSIQGTPTQQPSVVPPDLSRLSDEASHCGTQWSTTSTPIQGEVSSLPDHSTENVSSLGKEFSVPTKLSDLPRSIQLKILPFEGKRGEQNRQNVTKILLKQFFSHDERLFGNTSGKKGYRQLSGDKLYGMKNLIFKICPLDEEKTDVDLEKEWRKLCQLIDVNNRRYRSELKPGRSKKRSQKSSKC